MWISRKRFQELEKRIADLEKTVQSQQRQITSYFHQLARPESLLNRWLMMLSQMIIFQHSK